MTCGLTAFFVSGAESMKRTSKSGFTLIEVMIAVAIIAILTAVALPSYQTYVLRGRLVAATNALSATRAGMEQFYQDNRTYVGGPCSTSQTASTFTVICDATAPAAVPTATTYTIRATGSGATAGFTYTIDQSAVQQTTSWPTAWGTPPTGNCWFVRKGDTSC
jgi:type IV pilus assembly protein PilE